MKKAISLICNLLALFVISGSCDGQNTTPLVQPSPKGEPFKLSLSQIDSNPLLSPSAPVYENLVSSPPLQGNKLDTLSDVNVSSEELDRIAAKVTVTAENNIMTWLTFSRNILIGTLVSLVVVFLGIVGLVGKHAITSIVNKQIDEALSKLENARQEAVNATVATKAQLSKISISADSLYDREEKLEVDVAKLEQKGRRLQEEMNDNQRSLNEQILEQADQLGPTIKLINMILEKFDGFEDGRTAVCQSLNSSLINATSSDEDRHEAALVLQELRNYEPALRVLVRAITEPSTQNSLDTILPALGSAVKDAHRPMPDGLRRAALEALPLLKEILANPIHPNLVAAIGTIGDYVEIVPQPDEVVSWLVTLTESVPSLSVDMSTEESTNLEFAVVHKALPLAFEAYHIHSAPAVPWLVKMLSIPISELRRNVAVALGAIGAPATEAVGVLTRFATNPNEVSDVQNACRESIDKIMSRV